MSVKKVKITHEETGLEAEVLETTVSAWETAGWTVVEDESVPEQANPAEASRQQLVAEASKTKTNGGPAAPDTSKKE
jgi:hypothetical protein